MEGKSGLKTSDVKTLPLSASITPVPAAPVSHSQPEVTGSRLLYLMMSLQPLRYTFGGEKEKAVH